MAKNIESSVSELSTRGRLALDELKDLVMLNVEKAVRLTSLAQGADQQEQAQVLVSQTEEAMTSLEYLEMLDWDCKKQLDALVQGQNSMSKEAVEQRMDALAKEEENRLTSIEEEHSKQMDLSKTLREVRRLFRDSQAPEAEVKPKAVDEALSRVLAETGNVDMNMAALDEALQKWYATEDAEESVSAVESKQNNASMSMMQNLVEEMDREDSGILESAYESNDAASTDNAKMAKQKSSMDPSARHARMEIAHHIALETRKLHHELDRPVQPKSPFSSLRKATRRKKVKAPKAPVEHPEDDKPSAPAKSASTNPDLQPLPLPKDLGILGEDAIWEKVEEIQDMPDDQLKFRPIPAAPMITSSSNLTTTQKLQVIQKYIRSLEYNHTGVLYFNTEKRRSLRRIMDTAKEIVAKSLPIKCLEAVMLGMYLTKDIEEVVRFPLRFKTRVMGDTFWHIVLAVRSMDGKFGAIGLSRRHTLDFKEMKFPSLSKLIESYRDAYKEVGHSMRKLSVGLPVGRNSYSIEPIYWHFLVVHLSKGDWGAANRCIDQYAKDMTGIFEKVKKGSNIQPFGPDTVYEPKLKQLHFLPRKDREMRVAALQRAASTSSKKGSARVMSFMKPTLSSAHKTSENLPRTKRKPRATSSVGRAAYGV